MTDNPFTTDPNDKRGMLRHFAYAQAEQKVITEPQYISAVNTYNNASPEAVEIYYTTAVTALQKIPHLFDYKDSEGVTVRPLTLDNVTPVTMSEEYTDAHNI